MTYVTPSGPWSIDAAANADDLQAYVETAYIQTGNDMLYSSLNTIGQQMISTRDVLNTLNDLQTLKNQLSISNRSGFNANATSNASTYIKNASGFFSGISPTVNLTSTQLGQYNQLKQQLASQLLTLSSLDSTQAGVANSLVTRARAVLSDMNGTSAAGWVLDGYNNIASPSAGDYQTDLTFAVNSAESLNTTQQEQAQSMLFTFETFYQSALAVQQGLNDSMVDMARKISGN